MLDDFLLEQSIACKIIKNAKEKNKLSHAYLLETNGYSDKKAFAVAIAKYLLCPKNQENKDDCVKCTICKNIDKNIFEDLKIIEPAGLWIKKEQLIELQSDFSKISVQSGKKIYIITDATRLNTSSSNSLLKFLEEPNLNIIAILMADNIHQLLDTIISRCQIISLNSKLENNLQNYLSVQVENLELIKNTSIEFINKLEKKHEQMILLSKKNFHNIISEKNDLIASFEIMILYYKDILNLKIRKSTDIFNDIDQNMLDLSKENIIFKINKLIELKKKVYINANTNLLIDRLILELGGFNENSRN